VCVLLIIKRPCSPCQISLTFSLRHEEEKGFRSSAVSLCVRHWFQENEMEKLCNFVLFCEYISALPLATAVTVLPFQTWETVAVVIADPVRM
jgi:hypothetical protein